MKSNNLILGAIIVSVYTILRYIDLHYINKADVSFKKLLQEGVIVFISYLVGTFIYNQIEPGKVLDSVPGVFVSDPGF
jgi:hypothetical protein